MVEDYLGHFLTGVGLGMTISFLAYGMRAILKTFVLVADQE